MAPPLPLSQMFACPCCLRCFFSYTPEELEKREASRRIDKLLKEDEPKFRRLVKLLLLGAGESGKSTFLKQMKIIHGFKFDPVAVEEFRGVIYQNVVQGMKVLVDARQKLGIPWEFPENEVHADAVMQFSNRYLPLDENAFLTFAGPVQVLWKDSGIKAAFGRRREFQLVDSVRYFFENLERIARPGYVVTNQDILHARKATKGISEFVIHIRQVPFHFVDVGGQRSQRQKWLLCFENVTSILFLVSSSEFDQTLVEDRIWPKGNPGLFVKTRGEDRTGKLVVFHGQRLSSLRGGTVNRFKESCSIFDTIVNHAYFKTTSVILFLNKTDLLEEKVNKRLVDIRDYFPEFEGDPWSLEDVQQFEMGMLLSRSRHADRRIFYHFTTAVDTENIKVVFTAVKDTILGKNLADLMLQ